MVTLTLPYPPSINHCFSYVRGRPVLTKEARSFRQQVRQLVLTSCMRPMFGALEVRIEIHPPDKRKRDIDNCLKSLLDALQHGGAFMDDSQITVLHAFKRAPVREGHVVVEISQTEDSVCQNPL